MEGLLMLVEKMAKVVKLKDLNEVFKWNFFEGLVCDKCELKGVCIGEYAFVTNILEELSETDLSGFALLRISCDVCTPEVIVGLAHIAFPTHEVAKVTAQAYEGDVEDCGPLQLEGRTLYINKFIIHERTDGAVDNLLKACRVK